MVAVRCKDLTAADAPKISRNVRSVYLERCALPVSYLRSIGNQLLECGATLQGLYLIGMGLSDVEEDLDKLLERIVSLHESGGTYTHLILKITGDGNERTNLSQEFMQKWNKRCKWVPFLSIDWLICDEYIHPFASSNKPITETKSKHM